jgi:hypothetical protein
MRWGGTVAISYGLSDSLSVYVSPGYFLETGSTYDRTLGWFGASKGLITNTSTSYSISEIPIFAGINYKVGPGIKMTVGYGFNFGTKIEINNATSVTNKWEYSKIRGAGYFDFDYDDQAEFQYYGDTFMDMGFLKFGGDVSFAQSWTLGLAAGVGLNDKWSKWWEHLGTKGEQTAFGAAINKTYGAQLLSFFNLMNYDNNMYIKYEDDKVAIKGTFAGNTTTSGASSLTLSTNVVNSGNTPINGTIAITGAPMFGFFAYMDFTIKY